MNIFGQDTYREEEVEEALEQVVDMMSIINWEGSEGWTLERLNLFAAITLKAYQFVNVDGDELVDPIFVEDYIHKTYFEKVA